MTNKQAECVQRIRALVFFAGQDEEPFLEETVPVWLKLYPAAEVFIYFDFVRFLNVDATSLAGNVSQAHRVHVYSSSCPKSSNGLPAGNKAVTDVLDAVTSAATCTGALSTDYIMRIPPFTIPMRTEYIAQSIEQGAVFILSNGGLSPIALATYMLTVELWHRLMRIVSLMNVIGLHSGYADLYIQGFVFAVAHAERFMYIRPTSNVGNTMHHVFDYERAENKDYINGVIPLAGYISMRENVDCDMKQVMQWARKLSIMSLTYNAAS